MATGGNNPYRTYRETQVETVDSAELIITLYQGALQALRRGKAAMATSQIEEVNAQLIKAQDILCALMEALNPQAGQLSVNLFRIYEYLYHRLIQANLAKDASILDEASGILLSLKQSWQEAALLVRRQAAPTKKAGVS